MIRAAVLAAGLALPGSLAAEEFAVPEGCTAYLTIQHRDCTVSHHYTCAATPGHRWRADLDGEGLFFTSRIDAEAQWIESWQAGDPVPTRTILPARDPASITTLLESGYDDFDFDQIDESGLRIRVQGFDRLTGGSTKIDGEDLLHSEFSWTMRTPDGALLLSGSGSEYVSPRHRLFLARQSELRFAGEELPLLRDRSPVSIIGPGAPGFLALRPSQSCGMEMAALALSLFDHPDGDLP